MTGTAITLPCGEFYVESTFSADTKVTPEMIDAFIESYQVTEHERRTVVTATLTTGWIIYEGYKLMPGSNHETNVGRCKGRIAARVSDFLAMLLSMDMK